jgi:TonB family protein
MQTTALALAFVAFTAAGLHAQQAASPSQSETQTVPVTPYKPMQTSSTDEIPACPEKFEHHPEVDGIYKIGNGVTPPKATYDPEAEFSDEARKMIKKAHIRDFQAVSTVGLVVDAQGLPQDICLKKPAGYKLDEQAVKAVRQYRFKPATKDGTPVAVRIVVAVNFKTY